MTPKTVKNRLKRIVRRGSQKDALEEQADAILEEDAKKRGQGTDAYLRDAGILSERRERRIHSRELPLGFDPATQIDGEPSE